MKMQDGQRQLGAATATIRACPGVPDRLRGLTRELCNVHVPAEARQRGEASALLRQLCAEADDENVMLILFVEPFDGGPDADVLARWYGRHGFAEIQAEPVRMMARMIGATPRTLGAAGVPSAPMEARQ